MKIETTEFFFTYYCQEFKEELTFELNAAKDLKTEDASDAILNSEEVIKRLNKRRPNGKQFKLLRVYSRTITTTVTPLYSKS